MTYLQLLKTIKTPIFTFLDVLKYFPEKSVAIQLKRFAKRGLLVSIKRELYCFSDREVDSFTIANQLYTPSYISLETALNYYGIIPDIPLAGVTSVSPTTTKKFVTLKGTYFYQKLCKKLFWGYTDTPLKMAFPEKALLDYTYFYGEKATQTLRIDWTKIDKKKYTEFKTYYD